MTNAGGAVGSPFLPVFADQVRVALEATVEWMDPQFNRLLLANVDSGFAS